MTTALEGGEWLAARPGRTLPPGNNLYPLYRELDGPQGRSGWAENLAPSGFDPRTVQSVVSRYIYWATRPTCRVYYSKINWEIVHLVGFTIEIKQLSLLQAISVNLTHWATNVSFYTISKFIIHPVTRSYVIRITGSVVKLTVNKINWYISLYFEHVCICVMKIHNLIFHCTKRSEPKKTRFSSEQINEEQGG